jgi:hypothetical protein
MSIKSASRDQLPHRASLDVTNSVHSAHCQAHTSFRKGPVDVGHGTDRRGYLAGVTTLPAAQPSARRTAQRECKSTSHNESDLEVRAG